MFQYNVKTFLYNCSFNRYIIYHCGYKPCEHEGYEKKQCTSVSPRKIRRCVVPTMRRHCDRNISVQLIGFPNNSLGICQRIYTREKPYEYREYENSSICPGSGYTWNVTPATKKCYKCSQCGKALCSSSSLQRSEKNSCG